MRDSRGSASVEFTVLAIPLFLPLFIFFNSFAHSSDVQDSLRSLARESVRAYVTSRDDETGEIVARGVIAQGGELLGITNPNPSSRSGDLNAANSEISMAINCSNRPCISPNSKVEISLTLRRVGDQPITVSAIEYVSPWA